MFVFIYIYATYTNSLVDCCILISSVAAVGVAHFLRVRRCLFRHFRYFDYEMPEAISRVIEI